MVGLMLASTVAAASLIAVPAGGAHTPSAPASTPITPARAPSPAAGNNSSITYVNGTFFNSNSTFSPPYTYNNSLCYQYEQIDNFTPYIDKYIDSYCYYGEQSPSVLSLGGNTVGVGYSILTNQSATGRCLGTNDSVVSTIDFQVSNDSGAHYGAPVGITNATCAYVNGIEPSFAVSATSTIYGAYIEDNVTSYSHRFINGTFSQNYTTIVYPFNYSNRSSDALGFTYSTDGGMTFANVSSIANAGYANLANPEVTTFGDTVYVLYENIMNGTTAVPSVYYTPNASYPISLNLVYSTDDGVSWNGPYTLPGLNASQGNTSEGASISVNSLGEIAVSYATNRSCPTIGTYYTDCGGEIVVATSSTNGTSWSVPSEVYPFAGEMDCEFNYYPPPYYYDCLPSLFQWGPATSVAWSPLNPSELYVAWAASYYTWNVTPGGGEGGGGGSTNIGFGSALFDAVSANGGASWTQSKIEEPISGYGYDYDMVYQPTLTVSPTTGEVYVSYTWMNETYCNSCNPVLSDTVSYWIGASSNGLLWTNYPVDDAFVDVYISDESWTGLNSAITVTPNGPVAVYSAAMNDSYSNGFGYNVSGNITTYAYFYNETYLSTLLSAFPSSAPPLAENFVEEGLPANSTWTISLSGNTFSANTTTIQVGDVEPNATLYFSTYTLEGPYGNWSEWFPTTTVGGAIIFTNSTTVLVNYSLYLGFAVSTNSIGIQIPPSTTNYYAYFDFDACTGNICNDYEWYADYYAGTWNNGTFESAPFPWFYPANSSLPLTGYDSSLPVSFIFGTGNGSDTGLPTNAAATLYGPVTEMFFLGAVGEYSVTVGESGLSSGTTYSFNFDGTPYSAVAPATVVIPNVITGAYPITDISATSSTPGWEYFGTFGSGEVEVPVAPVVTLNFSTYIDVGAASGTVTFQASGLASGDFWQMSFNGTTYGSSSPWINVTAKPGTYLVGALPVIASANDTTAYAPSGFGPTLSVATGQTYSISYTLSYRVQVGGTTGGLVTGGGTRWAAPGSAYTAHASPSANYNFLGWSGTGHGSYSGTSPYANGTVRGPVSETAQFQPLQLNRYTLTVIETGLPNGTSWTVELNGTGYSSTNSSFPIVDLFPCTAGAEGQYSVRVPYVNPSGSAGVQYRANGYPTTTCTNGATHVTIPFSVWYQVTPYTTQGGYIELDSIRTTQSLWVPSGNAVGLTAVASTGYQFDQWLGTGLGSYSGTSSVWNVFPGGPVTETALFSLVYVPPPATWTLGFHMESTLDTGTVWGVTVNGTAYSSATPWINLTGEHPGPYTVTVPTVFSSDRSARYVAKSQPGPIELTGNDTITVAFSTGYLGSVEASTGGGSVAPSAGAVYYAAGSTVALVATPNPGYSFVGWVGTGPGAYTGPLAYGNVSVTGPFSEVASFAPSSTTGGSSSSWITSPAGIAVLAVVGLVVGVGIGYAVFARGRNPPGGGTSGGAA